VVTMEKRRTEKKKIATSDSGVHKDDQALR
jgi:hypothetical protein